MLLAELGGKGNPRIMGLCRHHWEAGTSHAENVPVSIEYVVTLWDYTITVRTRAKAAQLLYSLKSMLGGNDA